MPNEQSSVTRLFLRLTVRELGHREYVRIVEGHLDEPVLADRVRFHPVRGQAVELVRSELDRRVVVADVALEGLGDLG